MDVINRRRSVREFNDLPVASESIQELLKAAMQAPSGGNQQPWEFIVVEDEEVLKKMAENSPYASCVAKAPVAIVFVANNDRMQIPDDMQQDLSAACENLLLEAVNQDLGAAWISVYPFEERYRHLQKVLDCPRNIIPFNIVAVGHPLDEDANSFVDRFDEKRIHFNRYHD